MLRRIVADSQEPLLLAEALAQMQVSKAHVLAYMFFSERIFIDQITDNSESILTM